MADYASLSPNIETMQKIMEPIAKGLARELSTDVVLDVAILVDAARFIQSDFARMQEHGLATQGPDIYRVAALYVYWIARLKPAHQIDFAKGDFKIHNYLNEYLAMQTGLSLVAYATDMDDKNSDVDATLFQEAVWALRTKTISQETTYWMLKTLKPEGHSGTA